MIIRSFGTTLQAGLNSILGRGFADAARGRRLLKTKGEWHDGAAAEKDERAVGIARDRRGNDGRRPGRHERRRGGGRGQERRGVQVKGGGQCKAVSSPAEPEQDEWVLSHNPFRSWCRQCVAGRGLEHRHLGRKGGELDEQTYISIDYGYLAGDATPMLVVKDRLSGMVFAMAVERKGVARVRETLLHFC